MGSRRWITLRRFDDRQRDVSSVETLCGADEVGRGPLAGPLVAAAVCLPRGAVLRGLDDSKVLTAEAREDLDGRIRSVALAVGWAVIGPRAVDRLNTHQSSLLAMRRSLERVARRAAVERVLVDGIHPIAALPWPQETVVDGDARSLAIAAASVVAKCVRDRFMRRLGAEFPQYGFERHKGYATREHLDALITHGPCWWHRYSFGPVMQPDLFAAVSEKELVEV
jgi:ribonuclease HII